VRTLATLAQERVLRLTATLSNLRDRVREAVAGEMGRAVGDAVRDLLTAALHRQAPSPPTYSRYGPGPSRAHEDEPEDPWDDEEDGHEPLPVRHRIEESESPTATPEAASPPKRWATAVTVGFALARWLVTRRLPTLPAIAAGIVATAVLISGGSLVPTSLATLEVARDLLATF
jgi:hypothetical protein